MRHTILVFIIALKAGITQTRADQIVTYYMTGTLTDTSATVVTWPPNQAWYHGQHLSHPYAAGDHISWTLRYDSSTPVDNYTGGINYHLGNAILNIVDQTTGYRFPVISNGMTSSTLTLSRYPANPDPYGGQTRFSYTLDQGSYYGPEFANGSATQRALLQLNSGSYWKETSLTNLHLNTIPFALGAPIDHEYVNSSFFWVTQKYSLTPSIDSWYISKFDANVDSISVSMASTSEPGSVILFVLGAIGLTARSMCRRLLFQLVSFLAVAVAG